MRRWWQPSADRWVAFGPCWVGGGMADASTTPTTPWRRRIGTAPKTWVIAMAAGVCLGWLPFVGSPAEPRRGRLPHRRRAVGRGQQPVRRLLGRPAAGADRDLRGGRRAGRGGAAAAARRARSGPDGDPVRRARPARRAGAAVRSPAHRRDGGRLRRHAAVRRQRGQRRAAGAAVPGRRDPGVRRRGGQPLTRSGGSLLSLAAGAAGALGALVKQSMVDVFVLAAVLLFTSGAARRSSRACWPARW